MCYKNPKSQKSWDSALKVVVKREKGYENVKSSEKVAEQIADD
jgi:hypothetical protein